MSMGERPRNGGSLSRIRCGNFERRDRSMRGAKGFIDQMVQKVQRLHFGGIWR